MAASGKSLRYSVNLAGIDGKTRSASVVALQATRAARLPGAAFRDVVTNHPTFAWMLLEHLSTQLRRMVEKRGGRLVLRDIGALEGLVVLQASNWCYICRPE